MNILKFKKTTKGRYKLFLDNDKTITLYEDVIVNNNLLVKKEIDEDEFEELEKQNNEMHVYMMALNYISIRMRSIREIREYLLKKDISVRLVTITVEKLTRNGYLNDFNFAKAYIHDQLLITPKGPYKIRLELERYGVNKDIIDEVFEDIDENMLKEKLSNLMEKEVRIKKGSSKSVKTKIINHFHNLGYSRNMILNELSNYKLKSDPVKLEKDYEKIYNKYKDSHSNSDLLYLISNKLHAKGYTKDDIKKVLKDNN